MTPSIMYGTAWKEDATAELVRAALAEGFRAIDTANQRKHYFEAAVGEAIAPFIKENGRDSLDLQTKFTYVRGQDHRLPYDREARPRDQVLQSFASSQEHLGVERIDSYVLHGPETGGPLTAADWEVWATMETLVDDNRVGVLGVSNVNAAQLAELLHGARIAPTYVQNRCYASRGWDRRVRQLCRDANAVYQGFSLLTANREVWGGPDVATVATRLQVTPAAVIIGFARHLGMLPLTGTSNPEHMRDDLAAVSLELAPDEVSRLESIAG